MSANFVTITEENFEQEVLQSDLPVMIDLWAVWCAPCKAIEPIVEQIANEYNGKLKVGKLDVDSNQRIAVQYGVRSIPTLLFFKDGELQDQLIGAVPKQAIVEKINKVL